MAQLLMQGTGFTNFIGKYCYVAAGEHGFEAVVVTESTEPQAVIGSSLHQIAYPENFEEHLEHGRELEHSHEHPGRDIIETLSLRFRKPEILDLQHRGEYLYAACGEGGLRVFDIAFIDDKAFSERITTAPVSPVGPTILRANQVRHRRGSPDDHRSRSDARPRPDQRRTSRFIRCTPTSM